ncbi:hypothetical protein BDQ17DRAFT_1426389 [Cyathus striatus]|nr:hypothetical protein BDQ17DRAFT_1426389 [Cyathus striatus]
MFSSRARYQVPARHVPRATLPSPYPRESHPPHRKYPHPSLLIAKDKEMIQSLLILGCLCLSNSWITIHHIDLPISSFLMYLQLPTINSANRAQEVVLAVQKNFCPFLNVTTIKLSNIPTLEDVPEGDQVNHILNSIRTDLIHIKVYDTRDEREIEIAVWQLYMQPIMDNATDHWGNVVWSLRKIMILGPTWFACSADFTRIISCNLCKSCDHPTFLCQFPERLGIKVAKEDLEDRNEPDATQLLAQAVAGEGQGHGNGSQRGSSNANCGGS